MARAPPPAAARSCSSATTAIVASKAPSIPDSNSSGTSTTAARGGGDARSSSLAPRRHPRADPRPQQPLEPRAVLGGRERPRRRAPPRSTTPSGATVAPNRATTASRTSSLVVQLVHDRVGRQHRRAEPLERRRAPSTCRRRSRRSARRTGPRQAPRSDRLGVGRPDARSRSAPASLGLSGSATSGSAAASARSLRPRAQPARLRRGLGRGQPRRSSSAATSAESRRRSRRRQRRRLVRSDVSRQPRLLGRRRPRRPRRAASASAAGLGSPRTRPRRAQARARRRGPASPSAGGTIGRTGSTWPSTRLIDSDSRRRSESISRILTRTGIARLDDLARVLDVVLGELGDVDEPLDAVEDLDERAERDDLRDRALELVADVVGVDDALPRILLGLLETERDPLALAVDVEHLDADGVADREDLATGG